jgi:hypothetical protein
VIEKEKAYFIYNLCDLSKNLSFSRSLSKRANKKEKRDQENKIKTLKWVIKKKRLKEW